MTGAGPPLTRKASAPWERLRPIKQDPLENMGFVSKGDSREAHPVSSVYIGLTTIQTSRVKDAGILLQQNRRSLYAILH